MLCRSMFETEGGQFCVHSTFPESPSIAREQEARFDSITKLMAEIFSMCALISIVP